MRYVKNGEPCTTFIGNYTILAGDAETVFTKLTDVLREKGIDCVKVVGLGSDGASVMTGPITGVGKRLSAISPHLVHVHCVAHRVALVASNAARDIEHIGDFRRTLNNVHFYFKGSAARYDRLRELHNAVDEGDFLSLKDPCSVRWLSFTRALESVFINWHTLVLSLEQEGVLGNQAAEGIRRQMQKYSFVASMHMLKDILPIMDRLNKCFQEELINLSIIKPRVKSTRQALDDHLRAAGEVEQTFQQQQNRGRFRELDLTYCGDVNVRAYQNMRTDFIQKLINNIDARFPPQALDILSAFGVIFDVQMYPAQNLRQFGTDALEIVIQKFAPPPPSPSLIDAARARRDFPELKYTLQAHPDMTFARACKLVIVDYPNIYPDFAVLANIALTIPVSSVPCERGFSWQNNIKTADRSRLTDAHVDTLMTIGMEGPRLAGSAQLIAAASEEFRGRKHRRK